MDKLKSVDQSLDLEPGTHQEDMEGSEQDSLISGPENMVFDVFPELDSELAEFKSVEDTLREHKIKFDQKTLKNAIVYDNQLDPKLDESMRSQKDRYPLIQDLLMHNPIPQPKKKKK